MPQNQVRVWLRDCLHGDTPFTEQPGGCGEQGNHMQVTLGVWKWYEATC